MPAERLTETVDRAVRPSGLGIGVLMVDLAQRGLHHVPADGSAPPVPVEDSVGGRAYQLTEIVPATDDAGTRLLWLPLLDAPSASVSCVSPCIRTSSTTRSYDGGCGRWPDWSGTS